MRRGARYGILALAGAVGGCAVGPDYSPPQVPVAPTFDAKPSPGLTASEPQSERWWEQFHDPVLDTLVARADLQNLDLKRAVLAVETYRAQYTIDFSKLFPDIETGGSYARRRVDSNQLGVPNPDVLRRGFDTWQWTMAAATWEIDVWGAVRRQIEAGVATVQASAESYRAALVSVRAEVAQAYMTLRQLQAQQAAAMELVRGYDRLLAAVEKKVQQEVGSRVDLAQVQSRRSALVGDAARFDTQIAQQVSGIAILLGESPANVRRMLEQRRPIPTVEVPVAVGVPSSLLLRRPDVRAAERRVQAATAGIGVAEAGYLPRFTFTGNFIIQAPQLSGLGNVSDNQTYVVNPAISWNFMNILTGATEATVIQAKAQAADALLQYQISVVAAVNQVEAAISSFGAAARTRASYRDASTSISQAYSLALQQYDAGTIDITALITYLQAMLAAQDGLAQAEGLVAQNYVALYRSLGGGWEISPMPMQVEETKRFNPTPTANDFLADDSAKKNQG